MPKKKQQPKQRGGHGGEAGEGHAWLEPGRIRFAHAKIARTFTGCGRLVRDTLAQIERGELQAHELPTITVLPLATAGDEAPLYCSLNNRRLWVLKQCAERGLLPDAGGGAGRVRVRVRARAPHEDARYTTERCSEKARFVSYVSRYGRPRTAAGQGGEEGRGGGSPAASDAESQCQASEAEWSEEVEESRASDGAAAGAGAGGNDGEEAKAAAAAASGPGAGREGHPQYVVAQVLSADRRRGSLLCELRTGTGNACALTGYENVEAGMKVILAPVGSEVHGREVRRVKVAGEWTSGIICGPVEMGWPGNASQAIVLGDSLQVGDAAPSALEAGAACQEGADGSEDEEPKARSLGRAGAKKANVFAALESDEGSASEEDLASDESDDDEKGKGKGNK